MNLLRLFFPKKNRIKYLSTELRSPIDANHVTPDQVLLFMATAAKDKVSAQRVIRQYNNKAGHEIVPLLPKQKQRSLRDRLWARLRRIEGSSKYQTRDRRRNTRHHACTETSYQPRAIKW